MSDWKYEPVTTEQISGSKSQEVDNQVPAAHTVSILTYDFATALGDTIAEKIESLLVKIEEAKSLLLRKLQLRGVSREDVIVTAPPELVLLIQQCVKKWAVEMSWILQSDNTVPTDRIAVTIQGWRAEIVVINLFL